MRTLELKDICGYLPYGLKFITTEGKVFELKATHIFNNHHGRYKGLERNAKLLLLPLSALTEQLPDGSVPIVVMSGYYGVFECLGYGYSHENKNYYSVFKVNSDYVRYEVSSDYRMITLQDAEYLYANHFDIHGLIDSGLAIDKRTVK